MGKLRERRQAKKAAASGPGTQTAKRRLFKKKEKKPKQNAGDRKKQKKASKELRKKTRKDDKANRKLVKQQAKIDGKTKRVELRALRKGKGGVNWGAVAGVAEKVGGLMGWESKDGIDTIDRNENGEMYSAATGGLVSPGDNDTIHVSDEQAEKLANQGVDVQRNIPTNIKYMDEDKDFIDDVTGKYIYRKEEWETLIGYGKRLCKDKPLVAIPASIVIVVAVVWTAVKGIPKLIKRVKTGRW